MSRKADDLVSHNTAAAPPQHWYKAVDYHRLQPVGRATYVTVAGRELAVFRLPDGGVAVTDNACPHAGGNLAGGVVSEGMVECPWHGWRFRLDTGASLHNDAVSVATYPCELRGDELWVRLAAQGSPGAPSPPRQCGTPGGSAATGGT